MGFWKEILKESRWVKENWKFSVGNENIIPFWTIGSLVSVFPFPFFFILLQTSLLQWKMFGITLLVMAVGILPLKGHSMIRKLI